MHLLYISASPKNCVPLETERSFEALQLALADPIEKGHILLDRIEQVTFDHWIFDSFTSPTYALSALR